jgi:hypothetical protein
MIVASALADFGQYRVPDELKLRGFAKEVGFTDGQFREQVVQSGVIGLEQAAIP